MAITATMVMSHVPSLCDANNSILMCLAAICHGLFSINTVDHVLPVKYWSAIGNSCQFLGQEKLFI